MKVQKFIEVRLLKKRLTSPVIDFVQYDTGVQLVFSLVDFDIPSGTSATLYVQKKSGKFVYQEKGITVSENDITVDLENQALTEHGEAKYQVMLKNGTDTVTTFAGVFRIEKSLADANAVESKTVIRAFDEAVADHVAEFQTKAEQIVQACIETIPDDYTAMEAKVNELANAVKGYLSGALVFADDVSPVEHNPVVKAKSKNMVTFGGSGEKNGLTYSCVNGVWTISGTPSVAYGGIQSRDITGLLEDGETYTISQSQNFASSSENGAMYLQIIAEKYDGTQNFIISAVGNRTFTVDKSQYKTYVMSLQAGTALAPVSLSGFTVQLEKGSKATEHTPYIDPSTVTVKRFGKNFLDTLTITDTTTTVTENKDGSVTIKNNYANGETSGASKILTGQIPAGRYRFTNISGTEMAYLMFNTADYSTPVMVGTQKSFNYDGKSFFKIIYTNIPAATTVTFKAQIEKGDVFTGYEAPNITEHIPSSDGTVSGLTSVSPNMTILTDTEGVIVECEYNRDTNKVIEKLTNAIIALGGTV